jgi:hypothetical protein
MGRKTIDLDKTVYELCTDHPGLEDALSALGFAHIKNPIMRNTAGRVMTLAKGARMLNVDFGVVVAGLAAQGYDIQP